MQSGESPRLAQTASLGVPYLATVPWTTRKEVCHDKVNKHPNVNFKSGSSVNTRLRSFNLCDVMFGKVSLTGPALNSSVSSAMSMPKAFTPSQMIKAERLRRHPFTKPMEKGGMIPAKLMD